MLSLTSRFFRLTFGLATLVSIAEAQTAKYIIEDVDQRTVKYKTYGGDSLDRAFNVLPLDAKNDLVIGLNFDSGSGDPTISKVRKDDLSIEWTKTIKLKGYDFLYSGTKTKDGYYVASGFTNSSGAGSLDCWIVKFNSSGDTLWTRTFGGPKDERGYEVTTTSDNSYVVSATTTSWGSGDIDGLILKLNASGDIVWHKVIGETLLDRTYSIVEVEHGDLIISGITNENYPGNSDILLYRLTKDGEVVWRKVMGGPKGEIAHCLLKKPDNSLILIGYSAEQRDSLSNPMIMHLTSSAEVISKFEVEPQQGIDIKLIDGFINERGDCVGTGFMRASLKSPFDIILFKFDFAKKNFTIKRLPVSASAEEAYGSANLSKNNALIVGHSLSTRKGDMLFIKWTY
jgi:hypothetical protein